MQSSDVSVWWAAVMTELAVRGAGLLIALSIVEHFIERRHKRCRR